MAHDIAWFQRQEERLKKLREEKEAKEGKKIEQPKPVVTPTPVKEEEPKQEVVVKNSSDDDEYFKFHKNRNMKNNPHYFCVEELLIPRVSNCDTQRVDVRNN